jgi:hypothetical protein
MSQIIQIKDINLGGISDSQYQGQKNSVVELIGFDIHSEPGIMKHNQKLTKESGTTVDDLVKRILPCSDGFTYLFGSTNGKVWSRSSTGVYALACTVAPSAGAVGIMDAWEYQGYIYYSMQSRLGRVAVGSPTNWAGRNDSWATFTNTDADFHPMNEVNQVLYIGDKNYLAQVDAGVFSANALDVKTPLRMKSLGKILTDILIGTFVNVYKVATEIFRWNTWSISFSVADDIPEVGINCFLQTDNYALVNAGTKGNFYLYNGSQLENFKRIPGDWTGTKEAYINPNASCNMFGLPLFGLTNVSGNPAKQGVYSLGGYDRNYPKVLNLEWLISTGNSSNIEIGAVELVGTVLLVSWKDNTNPLAIVYGIDKVDQTAKVVQAYYSTRVINIARNDSKTLSGYVAYRSLPNDSSIEIWYSQNYGAWTKANVTVDTIRKTVYLKESFPEANTLQIRVVSNSATGANVNNAPEIELAEFIFD